MRKIILIFILILDFLSSFSQEKKHLLKGMYLQWGYNAEWYTRSNIHFKLGNGSDFIVHNVKASDKPDYDAIYKKPADISIPQYNYRIGFYLNKNKSKAVEVNFDHAKYVVDDFQKAHVTGSIDGINVDADSILNPATFFHVEHTDGANWLHINYVEQKTIFKKVNNPNPLLNIIYKAGAGINIPRTDFTWRGDRLNNNFHVAGYNIGVEAGLRFYILKKLFIEGTGKTGYVRYVNALADTKQIKNSYLKHGFAYFEVIGLLGYDLMF